MSHRFRAAHLALLLVALSSPLVAGGGLVDTASAQQRTPSPEQLPAPDETVIQIQLQTDGDARWVVTAYFNVTNDRELESFNETARQFTEGETDGLGLDAFEQANEAAAESTGRTMNITGVERTTETDPAALSLSFTWTNFARVEGDARYVGDVFNTSDPWLTGLEPNQRLIVELPPGAGIRSGPPKQVQNGRIVWEGPTTFERGDLELVYNPGSATGDPGTPTSEGGPGTDGPNSPGGDGREDPFLWGGFFVVGLGIAVLSVYVLSMRDRGPFDSETQSADAAETSDDPPAEAAAATAGAESDPEDDGIDEELLSDEERVERLLERNGGRMKQANIVKETGWSNAKVSQLLSSMAEDDQIDKLRIGRENLISFPDEDVTDLDDE